MKNRLMRSDYLFAVLLSLFSVVPSQPVQAQTFTGNDLKAVKVLRPHYDPNAQDCETASSTLAGDDNIAKIYNYLVGHGLKDFQAAGILGNMQHESGYNPHRVQNTRTPEGDLSSPPSGNIGYGLAQWTPGSQLLPYAQQTGRSPGDLTLQLDYLWQEFQSNEKAAYEALLAATNVAEATLAFETKYERHAGPPQPGRIVEAERILDLVAAGSISGGTSSDNKPIIVLDPGHGGTTINRDDPETGLHDGDFDNPAERKHVFAVAQIAKTQLEQAGYQVILTKDNVEDSVFLRDRANIANSANAALAVSIHTQGDKAFGTWQEIYVQKVGLWRGEGLERQTFTDAALADKSQEYAVRMKQARDATEVTKGETVIKDNSFDARGGGIEPGNIPLVQLWSHVPWIYLEAGGNDTVNGLTDQQKAIYASAIVAGIKQAVPSSGSANNSGCNRSTGDLSSTVLAYAWPEYHSAPYVTKKPDYEQAVQDAQARRNYVGGVSYPGVDCGGFVTRVMVDSGFEPGYNYGGDISAGASNVGIGQKPWLDANWQLIGQVKSTAELQPGDVAIYKDLSHTYMYIGHVPGFGSVTASASLDQRAPMAGSDDVTDNNLVWYRKK